MNSEGDTLKTMIERAIAGGWGMFGQLGRGRSWHLDNHDRLNILDPNVAGALRHYEFEQIIFDPDFAKALFSKKVCHENGKPASSVYIKNCGWRDCLCEPKHSIPMKDSDFYNQYYSPWQYHIQQYAPMTNPNRLEYLRDWMEK